MRTGDIRSMRTDILKCRADFEPKKDTSEALQGVAVAIFTQQPIGCNYSNKSLHKFRI